MRKTQAEIFDTNVLRNRITVSDKELAFLLGVGVSTARKIAQAANAVYKEYGRNQNSVEKVCRYIEAKAGD